MGEHGKGEDRKVMADDVVSNRLTELCPLPDGLMWDWSAGVRVRVRVMARARTRTRAGVAVTVTVGVTVRERGGVRAVINA